METLSAYRALKEFRKKLPINSAIDTHEQAHVFFCMLRAFGFVIEKIGDIEGRLRSFPDSLSRQKDRGDQKPESIISKHPGILRSTDPCFEELLLPSAEEKRVVDMFYPSKVKSGFSNTHKNVPFVNSVSGTAYTLVACLYYYMQESRDHTALQKDVNSILKSYLTFSVKNGYHSFPEIICVLKSKEVQAIFEPYEFQPDLTLGYDLLSQAHRHACSYAYKICAQRAINDQILTYSFATKHYMHSKL